jgi:hypothetical protein
MTEGAKQGAFLGDVLTGLLQNSGVADALKQPIAEINEAIAATNVAMAAWTKAVASVEAFLGQYGVKP